MSPKQVGRRGVSHSAGLRAQRYDSGDRQPPGEHAAVMTDHTVRARHPRRSAPITADAAITGPAPVTNPEQRFARWHWRAALEDGGSVKEYEFRIIHRYVPAGDPPSYVEGHQFTLEWRDLFYPEGLPGALGTGSADVYVTEELRRGGTVAVRAQGVVGVPIWNQPTVGGLTVQIALAAPQQRFGDDMDGDNVFRVSYQFGGQRWYIARYDPSRSELSVVAATELVR
jgi:hypothetical protein